MTLSEILNSIERDIAAGAVVPVTPDLVRRITELVAGVEVDLDAPLPDDDD